VPAQEPTTETGVVSISRLMSTKLERSDRAGAAIDLAGKMENVLMAGGFTSTTSDYWVPTGRGFDPYGVDVALDVALVPNACSNYLTTNVHQVFFVRGSPLRVTSFRLRSAVRISPRPTKVCTFEVHRASEGVDSRLNPLDQLRCRRLHGRIR
jgi:hypothetical protein